MRYHWLTALIVLILSAGLICQQPGDCRAQPASRAAWRAPQPLILAMPTRRSRRNWVRRCRSSSSTTTSSTPTAIHRARHHDNRQYFVRMTPYAFVAAEMLGARLEVLATYESVATGTTTYRSCFVVNAKKFQGFPATMDGIHDYLRRLPKPARFVYHDKFSASSYLLQLLVPGTPDLRERAT